MENSGKVCVMRFILSDSEFTDSRSAGLEELARFPKRPPVERVSGRIAGPSYQPRVIGTRKQMSNADEIQNATELRAAVSGHFE